MSRGFITRKSISLFFLLLLAGIAKGDWLDSQGRLCIPKAGVQPVIDGQLDDVWKNVPSIRCDKVNRDNPNFTESSGFFDATLETRIMWDHDYLYFFFFILDDTALIVPGDFSDNLVISINDWAIDNGKYIGFPSPIGRSFWASNSMTGSQQTPETQFVWAQTAFGYNLEVRILQIEIMPEPDDFSPNNFPPTYFPLCRNVEFEFYVGFTDFDQKETAHCISWPRSESFYGKAVLKEFEIGNELPVQRVSQPFNIDGELDDSWLDFPPFPQNTHLIDTNSILEPLSSFWDDCWMDFRIAYDDQYLYLFVNQHDDLKTDYDFLTINFDPDNSKVPNDNATNCSDLTLSAQYPNTPDVFRKYSNTGCISEIRVDITNYVRISPDHNTLFGFNIRTQDVDEEGVLDAFFGYWWSASTIAPISWGTARLIDPNLKNIPDFAGNLTFGRAPLKVQFSPLFSPPGYGFEQNGFTFNWDLSTVQKEGSRNGFNTFTEPGQYDIGLSVLKNNAQYELTKQNYVHVTDKPYKILFISDDNDLLWGDKNVILHIQQMGFTVTPVKESALTRADVTSHDLVYVSENVSFQGANHVREMLLPITVPIISCDTYVEEQLGMSLFYGEQHNETELRITNPDHPLAAGFNGLVPVYNTGCGLEWGAIQSLPPGMIKIACLDSHPDKCPIYAYDIGKLNGNQARVVHFFIWRREATKLTPQGWNLFDAAMRWCLEPGTTPEPPEPKGAEFTMVLRIRSQDYCQKELHFGAYTDASDDFDSKYDVYAPPSLPSGGLDVRFEKNGMELFSDYRKSVFDTIEWVIRIPTDSFYNGYTLEWDKKQCPPFGALIIMDGETNGEIFYLNMQTNEWSGIPHPGVTNTRFIKIVYLPRKNFVYYSFNWNLVGIPIQTDGVNPKTLFSDNNAVSYQWDEKYLPVNTLHNGQGYWIRLTDSDREIAFDTDPEFEVQWHLKKGWNLISGPGRDVPFLEIVQEGDILIPGTIYGFGKYGLWGNDNCFYNRTDTLEFGRGYWVQAKTAGTITINPQNGQVGKALANRPDDPDAPMLEIADQSGAKQTLWFEASFENSDDRLSFSLPPVPPMSGFDARFSDGYRVTDSDETTILIQTDAYPVSITPSELSLAGNTSWVIGDARGSFEAPLKEGVTVQISDPNVTQLKLKKTAQIPTQFAVYQNYPNPFNPQTEIRFDLPDAGYVEITLFNIVGQKVRTLLSADQPAGSHQVLWDATDDTGMKVGSGVYTCRISTPSGIRMRKMLLLK